MKEAMEIHDQFLDKRGPVSSTHRCFPLPFDEKMRRKKKFRFFPSCLIVIESISTNVILREARNRPKVRAKAKIKQLVEPFSNHVPGQERNFLPISQFVFI